MIKKQVYYWFMVFKKNVRITGLDYYVLLSKAVEKKDKKNIFEIVKTTLISKKLEFLKKFECGEKHDFYIFDFVDFLKLFYGLAVKVQQLYLKTITAKNEIILELSKMIKISF